MEAVLLCPAAGAFISPRAAQGCGGSEPSDSTGCCYTRVGRLPQHVPRKRQGTVLAGASKGAQAAHCRRCPRAAQAAADGASEQPRLLPGVAQSCTGGCALLLLLLLRPNSCSSRDSASATSSRNGTFSAADEAASELPRRLPAAAAEGTELHLQGRCVCHLIAEGDLERREELDQLARGGPLGRVGVHAPLPQLLHLGRALGRHPAQAPQLGRRTGWLARGAQPAHSPGMGPAAAPAHASANS